MERGAWQATVHGLAKSRTRLSSCHSYSLKAFPWISSRKTSRLSHESSRLFSSIRVFTKESFLCIRWPEYWSFSFSISPSYEYLGLISCRMDWIGYPCSPRDSQESSLTPQFKSVNSSVLSFRYGPNLTSIHDYWKNHSFD